MKRRTFMGGLVALMTMLGLRKTVVAEPAAVEPVVTTPDPIIFHHRALSHHEAVQLFGKQIPPVRPWKFPVEHVRPQASPRLTASMLRRRPIHDHPNQ